MNQYRNRNLERKRYINRGVALTNIAEFIGFSLFLYVLVLITYVAG